jgi:hypothetical protein
MERLHYGSRRYTDTINGNRFEPGRHDMLDIGSFVLRAALGQKFERRIPDGRFGEIAIGHSDIKSGQVTAVQMPHEVGGAELNGTFMFPHVSRPIDHWIRKDSGG